MLKDFNRIYAVEIDVKSLETNYNSKAIFCSSDKGTSTILVKIKKDDIPMVIDEYDVDAIFECSDSQVYLQECIKIPEDVGVVAIDLKTDVLTEGVNKFRIRITDSNKDRMILPYITYKVMKGIEEIID